jgi:putative transcriptional regulator
MSTLTGHFLVASPHLGDPNFFRSVVLVIRHDEEGAFGVVLNRPLPSTVREIWKALGNSNIENKQPIYLGGPVTGPLLAVHADEEHSEGEVLEQVFYSTHKDYLNHLVEDYEGPLRIFSGYSGWGEGQLEHELSEGSWLTTLATAEDVFAEPEEMWKSVASRIGLEILMPRMQARHVPPDPEMN